MIYVGIDVAKDKHDCFIINSDGEVLFKAFSIANNRNGFNDLYQKIESVMEDVTKVKVGLEATGHYSYNLLGYLIDKGLPTYVINPLHTNLYRKSLSLRQTKTDKVDARTIASMLMSDVNLKSYCIKIHPADNCFMCILHYHPVTFRYCYFLLNLVTDSCSFSLRQCSDIHHILKNS